MPLTLLLALQAVLLRIPQIFLLILFLLTSPLGWGVVFIAALIWALLQLLQSFLLAFVLLGVPQVFEAVFLLLASFLRRRIVIMVVVVFVIVITIIILDGIATTKTMRLQAAARLDALLARRCPLLRHTAIALQHGTAFAVEEIGALSLQHIVCVVAVRGFEAVVIVIVIIIIVVVVIVIVAASIVIEFAIAVDVKVEWGSVLGVSHRLRESLVIRWESGGVGEGEGCSDKEERSGLGETHCRGCKRELLIE